MAGKLIKHLSEKAKEHPHLQLLDSQWNFDQELIPKALQNVASVFPHYSRHDASHSRQILINIERLLGDTLEKLTATDTWMLLEAAYWHDIGMLVTSEHITADLKSEGFAQYLRDTAAQKGNELQEFARNFSSLDPANCFSAAATPQQAVERYRQLLAGWYRTKHPTRSDEIVNDPWKEAGISSPRNELVPKRLFRLLGQICRLHGAAFESVVAKLPFSEAGMATEDCHPRFIACLLRLGDLFDLDDNRFCPSMLRTAGEVPASSRAHLDKHAAIRHFRLDPEYVELSAECETYEGYEAADQWFTWIKDELRDQLSCWKNIVPSREFGLLPTLGKMEVNLAPPNEIIDPGERPHFGLDPEKTIELLQGAGLYESHWQSIRELLQNAVDATLLRIWLAHGEGPGAKSNEVDWTNPLSETVANLFAQYPIKVELLRDKQLTGTGRVIWRLRISDRGVGISKLDLGYMQKVGGSSRNSEKIAIVARMPNWMRPSGAFGIGLQSVFLIAEKMSFETKSMLHGDSLKVVMTSPTGRERGMIYITRLNLAPGRDFGSSLEFEMETDAIPESVKIDYSDNMVKADLMAFDPVRMADLPYAATCLASQIVRFSEFSPLPIALEFDGKKIATESYVRDAQKTSFYDPVTGITIIGAIFSAKSGYVARGRVAFRGQPIANYRPHIVFSKFTADLLSLSASDALTIDRNNIKESAQKKIRTKLISALTAYIIDRQEQFSLDEQAGASAFLFVHKQECPSSLQHKWQNLIASESDLSIASAGQREKLTIYIYDTHRDMSNKLPTDVDVLLRDQHHFGWLRLFSIYWLETLKRHLQIETVQNAVEGGGRRLVFSTEEVRPFTDSALKTILLSRLKSHSGLGGRSCCPVWGEFYKLAANIHLLPWCFSISDYHDNLEHFVLPFFFDGNEDAVTIDGLNELCGWVSKNALIPIAEDEVRKLYEDFIEWVDGTLMSDVSEWKFARAL